MGRRRKYVEDLTYAEWHREHLPKLYSRIGHRQDMADRDWTEYCHHCKDAVAIIEEVIDYGQDINDKATTVTRRLATRAGVPAFLMAVRIERPPEMQAEIERLSERLLELYRQSAQYVTGFQAKRIWPNGRGSTLHTYTPDEWAEHLLVLHRRHHADCFAARHRREIPVKEAALAAAKARSRTYAAAIDQQSIPLGGQP